MRRRRDDEHHGTQRSEWYRLSPRSSLIAIDFEEWEDEIVIRGRFFPHLAVDQLSVSVLSLPAVKDVQDLVGLVLRALLDEGARP